MTHPRSFCCDHGWGGPECFADEFLEPVGADNLTLGHLSCCYPRLRRLLQGPAPEWLERAVREHLAPWPEEGSAAEPGFDSPSARDDFERRCATGPMAAFMRMRADGAFGVRSTSEPNEKFTFVGYYEAFRRALQVLRFHAPPGALDDLDVFVAGVDCTVRSWPVRTVSMQRLPGAGRQGAALVPTEWLLTTLPRRLPVWLDVEDRPWVEKIPKVFWRGALQSNWCHWYAVPEDLGIPEALLPDMGPPASEEPCALWGGVHPENRTKYTSAASDLVPTFTLRNWYLSPRARVALLSKSVPKVLDAKLIALSPPRFFADPQVSELITSMGLVATERANYREHAKYRYLVTVDASDRVYWLLQLDAVLLIAQTAMETLFFPSEVLRPFEHFLPIKADLSDLVERVEWAEAHPEQAAAIARAGRRAARRLFGHEEALHILYRIIRAQSEARRRSGAA